MINQDDLKQAYNQFMEEGELTRKKLKGILFRVKRGYYTFLRDSVSLSCSSEVETGQDFTETGSLPSYKVVPLAETFDVSEPVAQDFEPKTSENELLDWIDSSMGTLQQNGILFLDPSDSEEEKAIHRIVETLPEVDSFNITVESKRRIVLRKVDPSLQNINYITLLKKTRSALYFKKYDLCIEKCRTMLEGPQAPLSKIYGRLGLAYMGKKDFFLALDYLTIASELAQREGRKVDFVGQIDYLKKQVSRAEFKPHISMKMADCTGDIHNYHGMDHIEEISQAVSEGKSIAEACLELGLSEQQRALVSLIFARECYIQEQYRLGDKYLKLAERGKNKPGSINDFIHEVRVNRNFYKNRDLSNHQNFTVAPKVKVKH